MIIMSLLISVTFVFLCVNRLCYWTESETAGICSAVRVGHSGETERGQTNLCFILFFHTYIHFVQR